jgi:hypothetical protein
MMANQVEPVRPRGEAARTSFGAGAAACIGAVLLGIASVVLLGLGQIPAVFLLIGAVALGVWGAGRLKKAEPSVR